MRLVRSALVAIFILSISFLSCAQESATPAPEEKSRSPFTTSPAEIALEEPCRYIGTFHKESRQLLEVLRARKVILLDETRELTVDLIEYALKLLASAEFVPQ